VNTTAPVTQLASGGMPGLTQGAWRVDPAQSHASFAARVAGRSVQGQLPMTGSVVIGEPIETSAARLTAAASAVRTGLPALDRLLASPGFLDAGAFPEISFSSELLVWVPAGWRAVGRLRVKGSEHELACQLRVQLGDAPSADTARISIASTWVLDSRWVTSQRIPTLGRRIVMTCSLSLEPDM
jgi:polyisoprenoid-binding protein YceI